MENINAEQLYSKLYLTHTYAGHSKPIYFGLMQNMNPLPSVINSTCQQRSSDLLHDFV